MRIAIRKVKREALRDRRRRILERWLPAELPALTKKLPAAAAKGSSRSRLLFCRRRQATSEMRAS